MAQLVRIGTIVNQKWSLKKDSQYSNVKSKEEDREYEERTKKSQKEVEEGTPLLASCQNIDFIFHFLNYSDIFLLFITMSKKIIR